jgi:diacylglycerol kinase (ATP)
LLARTLETLRAAGHTVTGTPTTGPRTAGDLARRSIEAGADLILAAGGDGTINEIVQGMAGSRTPLGVLPAGTANVLANEAGLPCTMDRAAAELGRWIPRRIGLGSVAGSERRYFLLMAGIGLDAGIVYRINLALKGKWGKAAYWIAGAGVLASSLADFRVETESGVLASTFTLVSRVRNYGGDFRIAPAASLADDSFEVVLFHARRGSGFARYLAGMMVNRLAGMRGVRIFRSRRLSLEAPGDPRVYVQVDGEFAGRLPVRIDFVPDALTLLLPSGYGSPAAWAEIPV